MFKKVFVSAVLASTVAASAFPGAQVVERAATTCSIPSSLTSVLGTVPTPPADLEAAFSSITNWCATPTFASSLQSEFTSYAAAVTSWAIAHAGALVSYDSYLASACPSYTASANSIPFCSTDVATAVISTAPAATSTSKGGASMPQATMMAAAAGVVAGAMGLLL